MSFSNKYFAFILFLGLFLAACNKENIDEIVINEPPTFEPTTIEVNNLVNAVKPNDTDGLNLDCVTINFPFELKQESGTSITINSSTEFEVALEAVAPNRVVDFIFPLTTTDKSGNTSLVNNNEVLGVKFGSCIPTTGWENSLSVSSSGTIPAFLFEALCVDLVYLVNLEDLDGNTYVANDEAELIDLCATVDLLFFTLPLTVVDEDGNETMVNNTDEFFNLIYECEGVAPPVVGNGIQFQGFACYELVYPIEVETADGTIITINDENEYANLVLSGESIVLLYPFSLINTDGETIEINSLEDLLLAFADCGIFITIEPSEPCDLPAHVTLFFNAHNVFTVFQCPFDINYPVEVIVEGNPFTLNDVNDYFSTTGAPSNIKETDLVYPIIVTQDGTEITLNSDDEVCAFIEDCE